MGEIQAVRCLFCFVHKYIRMATVVAVCLHCDIQAGEPWNGLMDSCRLNNACFFLHLRHSKSISPSQRLNARFLEYVQIPILFQEAYFTSETLEYAKLRWRHLELRTFSFSKHWQLQRDEKGREGRWRVMCRETLSTQVSYWAIVITSTLNTGIM